jgi:hypothetical protein
MILPTEFIGLEVFAVCVPPKYNVDDDEIIEYILDSVPL